MLLLRYNKWSIPLGKAITGESYGAQDTGTLRGENKELLNVKDCDTHA